MAHIRAFDATVPLDTDKEGLGATEVRDFKNDIAERLFLDHYMGSSIDTDLPTADGFHKKVTLYKQSADPAAMTGTAIIYAKEVAGKTEVFCRDATNAPFQITDNGSIAFSKGAYSAFKATMSVASSGAGVIPMNTVAFDIGSNYGAGTYRFIAPYAGIYFFQFYLSSAVEVYIKKGGATVFTATQQGTYTTDLVAGDQIELWSNGAVATANSHWSGIRLR